MVARLADPARRPDTARPLTVLDIGCGWGG